MAGETTEAMSDVVVRRTFDAPRALVYRAWTEPEMLKRWFAPQSGSTPAAMVDARPGGRFQYCMRIPEMGDVWGVGMYREVGPDRIVYVDAFADAEGNVVSPTAYGMSEGHPRESLVTVEFEDAPGGGTTVTVRHTVPTDFPEREGMEQGWSEMLARLADAAAEEEGR